MAKIFETSRETGLFKPGATMTASEVEAWFVREAAQKEVPGKTKAFVLTTARNLIINRVRREQIVPIEALTANVFLTDPRLFGMRVTKNWQCAFGWRPLWPPATWRGLFRISGSGPLSSVYEGSAWLSRTIL